MQTDEEVEAGIAEANFFALVSHQYWGVWTLIQAHHSAVDFDYLPYGRCALSSSSWRPRWLPAVCRPLQTILWLRDIARLENPAGGAF